MRNLIFLFVLVALGCTNRKPRASQSISPEIAAQKEVIVNGLARPWSIAFISEDEVLLSEKDGDLLRINLQTKKKYIIQGFPEDRMDSLLYYKADYDPGT